MDKTKYYYEIKGNDVWTASGTVYANSFNEAYMHVVDIVKSYQNQTIEALDITLLKTAK